MQRADAGTSIFLIVLTCAYLLAARGYEGGAGTVPTVVGVVTLIVLVVQLLAPKVNALKPMLGTVDLSDGQELFEDRGVRRRLLIISVSLLLIPVLILLVGIVVAVPVYVALALSVIGRQSLLVVVGCTVGMALIAYGLLVVLVSFPVDNGYLWQML